jgi:hypothetical protein
MAFRVRLSAEAKFPAGQIASYEEESERFEMFDGEIPGIMAQTPQAF